MNSNKYKRSLTRQGSEKLLNRNLGSSSLNIDGSPQMEGAVVRSGSPRTDVVNNIQQFARSRV